MVTITISDETYRQLAQRAVLLGPLRLNLNLLTAYWLNIAWVPELEFPTA